MPWIKDVYKFKLEEDYVFSHPLLKHVEVSTEWMNIKDGVITIYKGYAWNGCSPNTVVLGVWQMGTPDGALRRGKPWTYYDSLVHDALTQYAAVVDISCADSITIFSDGLKANEFPLEPVYTLALKLFFHQKFLGDK